jgi:hypothetical protein
LKQASCSDARAETEHGVRRSFVVQPQYGLNNMRVGLERANSCHDHDGFQASPHQVQEGASTSMSRGQTESPDQLFQEEKPSGRRLHEMKPI